MNQMKAALEKGKQRKEEALKKIEAKEMATKRSVADIIQARRLRMTQLGSKAAEAIPAEAIEYYLGHNREKAQLTDELKTLREGLGGKSDVPDDEIQVMISAKQARLKEIEQDLEVFRTEMPAITSQAIIYGRLAERIESFISAVRKMHPASVQPKDVTDFFEKAVAEGVMKKVVERGDMTWMHQSYAPANDGQVATEFREAVISFLDAYKQRGREIRDEQKEEAAAYLMSSDEIKALTADPNTMQNRVEFLLGKGTRCFVPLYDQRDGRSHEYLGAALLERLDNAKIGCGRATTLRAAKKLFFRYIKESDTSEETGVLAEVRFQKSEKEGRPQFDFSDVRSFYLRTNLEEAIAHDLATWAEKQAREAQSENRRTISADLRDISGIADVLTFAEFFAGQKGTVPVNVYLRPKDGSDGKWLTCHIQSDGETFYISKSVPGVLEKYFQRLTKYTDQKNPTKVSAFQEDKFLVKIGYENATFERNWQLQQEAEKRSAIMITADNHQSLLGIDGGADGIYALQTFWNNPRHRTKAPIGLVVQRMGRELKVLWAVPGDSARIINDEMEGVYDINALPKKLRAILRNLYMAFNHLRGHDDMKEVPAHLRPENWQEGGHHEGEEDGLPATVPENA